MAAAIAFVQILDLQENQSFRNAIKIAVMELDLPALFSTTTMFFLALRYDGNEFSWNSSTVVRLSVRAGTSSIFWVTWNWHAEETTMMPVAMIKRRYIYLSGPRVTVERFWLALFS